MSVNGPARAATPSGSPILETTTAYVETFYPRWFTHRQGSLIQRNTLLAPKKMSPLFRSVVAPNDDTLYAQSWVDVSAQPVVLTIPSTTVSSYSLLVTDVYGNVIKPAGPDMKPGAYALTTSDWPGGLPAGVTQVRLPDALTMWTVRAPKYAPDGTDQVELADEFRRSLRLASLADYQRDPSFGATRVKPTVLFAQSYKLKADNIIADDPMAFLEQLQAAVHDPSTPPLTGNTKELSDTFDGLFDDGDVTPEQEARFVEGAQEAHSAIVDNYLDNTDENQWIHFRDIGNWGTSYLDRASITEYIQFGNDISRAAYYHAFADGTGAQLDARGRGYVLTFPKDQIPPAGMFWSVTAYTPDGVTLVPNIASKYLVGSYTPGLKTNSDGSLSIYMCAFPPAGVDKANWLPVPAGPFNVMLRVYGPEGSVAAGTYVPPSIQATR
ncbi:DUF1214 domain-containing protein [Micromonospora sp. WMMA1363]|uniref:DUF1214 domain-containing protein n=1 Tax=Micromonospora sp. WMMA1363 TaxID=3053985 RepID=UPI00259CA90E|nr:DUF1214 domain-containing protein [Micromonospora sp. WMMA1363]MDM4718246.1 DUF1214 domain-containing protein [Micromonospora sp. WMMA1363]